MPKPPLSRHLVALWFADVAGYSARAAEDDRAALHLVEILQTLSRDIVRRHEGRLVKFMGDAVLAEFPSTEMAVCAAAALSQQYPRHSAETGRSHDLRVGVHVGDVAVATDGDLYGDGVNAAARIQAAAEPGQVVASEDVWRQLRGRGQFRFESLGERELKGVGPIGLYVVSVEASAPKPPPDPGSAAPASEERKEGTRSIAVLPFADLSAARDQEYLSDGVAEEILNALTKVKGLHVPARASCFAFRAGGVDVREIGERLGVETLLQGSIRKAGNRLRITVQLIDAQNGYHLWSERFDRDDDDIFAIQDEIALSVLEVLGLSLTKRDEQRILKVATTNVEAYEFYLRGRKLFQKWTRQSVEFARGMFERALKLDSDFAGAWSGLATAHVFLFRWGRNPQDLEAAQTAIARALALDPELAEAHVASGQALGMARRYEEAAAEYERAIQLDPTFFDAYYYYARSAFEQGDYEKTVRLYGEAQRVRPEDYQAPALKAMTLSKLERPDDAREAEKHALQTIEKYLELNPEEARAYSLGAGILSRLGDSERSRQWTEQSMVLAPDDPAILYNAACSFAVQGANERALDGLERAITMGISIGDWLARDPDWERLRDHPRFQALLQRIAPK